MGLAFHRQRRQREAEARAAAAAEAEPTETEEVASADEQEPDAAAAEAEPKFRVEQSGQWFKVMGTDGQQVGKATRDEAEAQELLAQTLAAQS